MDGLIARLVRKDTVEEEEEVVDESQTLADLQQLVASAGILTLVEKLGEFLVSEDTELRVKSTALLCECVCGLDDTAAALSTVQLDRLLDFFLTRYKTDWESALACLRTVKALLSRKSVDKQALFGAAVGKANEMAVTVLTSHDVAELVQTLRSLVFECCLVLGTEYRDYAFADGSSSNWFSNGFQQAMEGERDPRCLLVCLKVLRCIVVEAPHSWAVVEDAFELTNVYFPITFQPPPNDPFGITHGDLVDALNQVFVASEQMASCSLPMALERFKTSGTDESSVGALARVESLRLIALCCTKFNAEVVLAPHLQDLRDSLVALVMQAEEPELVVESLNAITLVARSLSSRGVASAASAGTDPLWDAFALQILRVCGQSLEASMDSMSAQSASKIICAVAQASSFAFGVVMQGILPLLNKLLLLVAAEDAGSNAATKRLACFELIRNLCRCVDSSVVYVKGDTGGPLDRFVEPLFAMVAEFVSPMQDEPVIVSAFLTLKEIACRPREWVSSFNAALCDQVEERILTLCLDPIRERVAKEKKDVIVVGLVTLRDLERKRASSSSSSLFLEQRVVDALLEELTNAADDNSVDVILSVLPMLLMGSQSPGLIQRVVQSLLLRPTAAASSIKKFDAALARIGATVPDELVESTLAFEDIKSHPQLLSVYLERISPEANHALVQRALAALQQQQDQPLERYVPTVLLAMRRDQPGVLAAIVREIEANPQKWTATGTGSELLLDVFTCALNKAPADELHSSLERMWGIDFNDDEVARTRLYARAFKALVWRSSTGPADRLGAFLHAQLHSHDNAGVRAEASRAFASVLKVDGDDAGGLRVPFARVLGIAKQRTFTKWFKLLYDDLLSTSTQTQTEGDDDDSVLAACASLAASTPVTILKSSLTDVVSVMVRAAASPRPELQLCALQILKLLLGLVEQEGEFVASDHLHSLVPFLLRFTQAAGSSSVQTRLDALQCLETLPQVLKYHQLHPFRSTVSNTLARGALDDAKKQVRLQAVKCRERWVLFAAS